jgi:hypothetical protein
MPLYIRLSDGNTPPVKTAYVRPSPGLVSPVKRMYVLSAIVETSPHGPGSPMVLRYDWVTLGDFVAPWHTPDVPSLTLDPPNAATSLFTRTTLQNYQDDDERRLWSRYIQYANANNLSDIRHNDTMAGSTFRLTHSWDAGTSIVARAAFVSSRGLGPWSGWSQPVTASP